MKKLIKRICTGAALLVVAGVVYLLIAMGFIDLGKAKSDVQTTVGTAAATAKSAISESGAQGNSPQCAAQCRTNLKRIEGAKRSLHSKGMFATGSPNMDALARELGGSIPKCPCGGSYTFGSFEQLPRCSIGNGGTTKTEDDHVIVSY